MIRLRCVEQVSIESLLADTWRAWWHVDFDEQCVRQYMDARAVSPVVVFETAEGLLLADGFHRVEAARRRGATTVDAEIRQGSFRDVVRYAAMANRKPLPEPDEEYVREMAAGRENVREFRATHGLPTDDAVIDWLMTQWAIGLRSMRPTRKKTASHRWRPLWRRHEARCGRTRSSSPRATREPGRSTSTERRTCASASPATSPRTAPRRAGTGARQDPSRDSDQGRTGRDSRQPAHRHVGRARRQDHGLERTCRREHRRRRRNRGGCTCRTQPPA